MSGETTIILAVFLPLAGALGSAAAGRWPNLREAVTLATAGALTINVWSLLPAMLWIYFATGTLYFT